MFSGCEYEWPLRSGAPSFYIMTLSVHGITRNIQLIYVLRCSYCLPWSDISEISQERTTVAFHSNCNRGHIILTPVNAIGTQTCDLINLELARWQLTVYIYKGRRGKLNEEDKPASKHHIQPECGELTGWHGTGRPNPPRQPKFSGANGNRENCIFLFSWPQAGLTALIGWSILC